MKRNLRGPLIALTLAVFLSGHALAQAIIQSGPVVPGHVPVFIANGQVADGGYVTNPLISNLSLTNTGTPICINDVSTSSPSGYHQICLGANNASNGALLTYGAFAGASTLPFTFTVNGFSYSFNNGSLALPSLQLDGSSSGVITLLPQASAGTYNFNFPITAGTSGHPLLSGGGTTNPMTWGSLSGNTSTFATTSGSFTAGHCGVFDSSGNIIDNGSGCGGTGTINSGTTGQTAYYPSTGIALAGTSALTLSSTTAALNPSGGGTIDDMSIGATTASTGKFTTAAANTTVSAGVAGTSAGTVNISGATAGTVSLKSPTSFTSYNFNFPVSAGAAGQPLLSQAGGTTNMSWGTLSGSTSTFATTSGSLTNGHAAAFDSSGNIVDGGTLPTGTINSGTATQMAFYAGSGTTISGTANATIVNGALTMGVTGSQAGSYIISGSSTGAITLQAAGTAIGTYNFNLPATVGTANGPLLSQGGTTNPMTWGTVSGTTTNFGTVIGALTNGHCIAADANGNLIDNGSTCGTGGSGTVTSGTATQLAYYPSSTNSVAGNSSLTVSGSTLTVGVANSSLGKLNLTGNTSGTISIVPQATAGTYNFNLPTTAGSSGNLLVSGGGTTAPMIWSGAISLTATTATINPSSASTMDNVVIGGTTPLAGKFTTLTGTGAFNLNTGAGSYIGDSTGTAPAGPVIIGPVVGTSTGSGLPLSIRKSASTNNGNQLGFLRSRGTQSSQTIVTTGDPLGGIVAYGYDGANYVVSSSIAMNSIGTIASNQVPGQITFLTSNSGGSITTAMSIDQAQQISMPGLTTGTNADTVCLTSGFVLVIQASTCTISSKRFKTDLGAPNINVGAALRQIPLAMFEMKPNMVYPKITVTNADGSSVLVDDTSQSMIPSVNPDWNYAQPQFGLYAEDIAAVDPRLALYEQDGTTPKSYRETAMLGLLVAGWQYHDTEIATLSATVATQAATITDLTARLTALEARMPAQ